MYRQLAVITFIAAAVGGGALAIGSATQPASAPARAAIEAAPARVTPAIPTIEIDPYYIPQQMNFP